MLCGYIYQANAWFGGGRIFKIEFQFQLVLSLVLGLVLSKGVKFGVKFSKQRFGLVLGVVLSAKVWCCAGARAVLSKQR